MTTHVKVLGILHVIMGSIGVLIGLMVLLFFGGIAAVAGFGSEEGALVAAPILGVIGLIALVSLLVLSLPSIIVGVGLIQLRSWARILGIILSALHLFNVPIGTAIGVYGLWALLSPGAEQLFERRGVQPIGGSAMRF